MTAMPTTSNDGASRSSSSSIISKAESASLSSEHSLGLENTGIDRAFLGSNRLYDVVQIALICRQHRSILFAKAFNGLYFPFVSLKPFETAQSGYQAKLKDLMGKLSINKSNLSDGALVDLLHIQIPSHNEYICRYTFRVEEKKDKESLCICKSSTQSYIWEKYEDSTGFRSKMDKFWAAEPVILLDKILSQPNMKEHVLQEITLEEVTKYLSDEVKIGDHPVSNLLLKLGYKDEDLYRCFLDYLNYTYPSIYMNKLSFQEWAVKSGLLHFVHLPERILPAFQIDPSKDPALGYIEFDEFLFGMLFIDMECPHQAPFSDIRLSYIFRYYNRGNSNLELDDLVSICKDVETVIYKNQGPALLLAKEKYLAEADTFWKDAGLAKSDKYLNWTKFQAACDKANKSFKYLNMENVLRTQTTLLLWEKQNDLLGRTSSLGRDYLEIFNKRDLICGQCEQKELSKWAEHTVKVFYNGAITEVSQNDKSITDSKQRACKAKRKASNGYFNEDYFPNILLESINNFFEKSATRATKAPISKQAQANEWSSSFATKNLNKIHDLLSEVGAMYESEMVRLSSPCVVCPDFAKLVDLFAMEHHMSQLVSFAFPIRFVYMVTWSDLNKNGLEFLLSFVARKVLLPDKYHFLIGKADTKKRDMARTWLSKQCETMLSKELGDKLLAALFKLLDKLPKCALIDESVFVLPGIENVDDLDSILANLEPSPAPRKDKKPKKDKKIKSPSAGENAITAKSSFTIYTKNESLTKKSVCIRTPDEQLLPIGKDRSIAKESSFRHLLILVEAEKIRPLYLVNG